MCFHKCRRARISAAARHRPRILGSSLLPRAIAWLFAAADSAGSFNLLTALELQYFDFFLIIITVHWL